MRARGPAYGGWRMVGRLKALLGLALAALVPIAAGAVVAEADRTASALARGEPGEELPGGSATTPGSTDNRDAFSRFSNGIGLQGEARFTVGNAVFRKLWVSAPSSTKSSDGLGPVYNARGCQNCHLKDGRGRPPTANWPDDTAVSMFLRLSIPPQTDEHRKLLQERRAKAIPEPTYGGQLQNVSVQGIDAEGQMHIRYDEVSVRLDDGSVAMLRKPTYSVTNLAYGPMQPDVMLSPRIAPQMIGLGLLEAIPEQAILAKADPADVDNDGISGRANEVWSHEEGRVMLGRFGWKAGNPTIRQQSADAFSGDMGLSTTLFQSSSGDCTQAETACLSAPNGNSPTPDDPEVSNELLDLVTFYAQNLAVPTRRKVDDPVVLSGKALFVDAGCSRCHTPSLKTGEVVGQPHLSGQKIWPYTDLLLHDMGEVLADHRPEGSASGSEWRTAPLWGVGLTETVSGHTFFLHDGRARSIEEAILWHGGEAKAARDAYASLSKGEREALLAFVNSL